jgi:hypothetical protein
MAGRGSIISHLNKIFEVHYTSQEFSKTLGFVSAVVTDKNF